MNGKYLNKHIEEQFYKEFNVNGIKIYAGEELEKETAHYDKLFGEGYTLNRYTTFSMYTFNEKHIFNMLNAFFKDLHKFLDGSSRIYLKKLSFTSETYNKNESSSWQMLDCRKPEGRPAMQYIPDDPYWIYQVCCRAWRDPGDWDD